APRPRASCWSRAACLPRAASASASGTASAAGRRSGRSDRGTRNGTSASSPTLDLDAVKARQNAMWASGDYGHIGVRLQIVGESLCEAAAVGAPDKVLDVAAGNGNASL